jgi:P4 family phage/plasmid primase-like protien
MPSLEILLEKLLRPHTIAATHVDDLDKSKIPKDVALAARIATVPPDMISKILAECNHGWALEQVESLLAFPYPPPNGGASGYFRVKVFPPIETKKGVTKYLQPVGSVNHLYLPPGVDPAAKGPIYITEGEKKALCLTVHGFPCIGLGGVYGWMKDGQPIPDLDAINWKGRDVVIAFDADIEINKGVAKAETALAHELLSRKAKVFVKRLPYGPGCARGADEFIAAHGAEAFRDLRPKPVKPKAKPPPGLYGLTDLGNANRLVDQWGNDLRWCDLWGKFLVWNGRLWATDQVRRVELLATETVKSIYAEAAGLNDKTARKAMADHAQKSESDAKRRAMLSSAKCLIPVLPDELDRDPWLLNVLNGTVDLRTGELRPHERGDLITKLAPVHFDAKAECPLWWEFLRSILPPEIVEFLQKAVGYSATGLTIEQVFFLLYGSGDNGKTTFLETVAGILGDYGRETDPQVFMMKRFGSIPNDLAALRGARFVKSVETSGGRRMSEARLKQMTGGDTLAARFLHQEWFDFKPEFKLWLGTNHKPVISDSTHAMWRRVRLIPFEVQIPPEKQDRRLAEKLRDEYPGILNWLIEGALLWQHEGLEPPAGVREATQDYRQEMDVLGEFLSECCVLAPGAEGTAAELYENYHHWAEAAGEKKPLSKRGFGLALGERGFRNEKGTGGIRTWRGIGLK